MAALATEIAALTRDFSGVVSVSRGGLVEFERAYGLADRAHGVPVTLDTQFGIASGTKGFTALVVLSLVAEGVLSYSTTARSLLGTDLPLVPDDVTVEHLLTHTSGIGDYVDEDELADDDAYVLTVPVHTLATTEGYLPALDGRPVKFPAGTRFGYCNSGYVLLALLCERATGRGFAGLVGERICWPAGLTRTAFLRSDRLPGAAAVGYLEDGRSNVLHLPVRGSGDGGLYSTAADLRAFWSALFAGRILPPEVVRAATTPQDRPTGTRLRNAVGFWRHPDGPEVALVGSDAGVSFCSTHDPRTGRTWTVLSNTTRGAGPVQRRLDALLRGSAVVR